MVRHQVVAAAVAALTLSLSVASGSVAAAPGSVTAAQANAIVQRVFGATNPDAAYRALTSSEQRLFWLAETPSGSPTSVSSSAPMMGPLAAGGNWAITMYVFQDNAFGQRLWTYWQTLNWSSNGTTLTSYSARKGPAEKMAGWTYTEIGGPTPITVAGGLGQSSVEVWGQGEFQFCMVGICVQSYYPWVDERGWASGTYTANYGY